MKKSIFYIIAVVLLLFSSCGENALDRKSVVVDIKSLSFDKDSLLFGGKQDIMIQGLSDSVLSITQIDDGFVWNLRKPAYVKFDGDNPNAINYDTIRTIHVDGQEITKSQIDSALQTRFEAVNTIKYKISNGNKYQYTRLADVLKKINQQNNPTLDSLKTLIAYKKGETTLILLDTIVTVNSHRFKSCDTIRSNFVKIEFFRTFYSDFISQNDTKKYFHKDSICFTTSVKSFYTPFGANEITLTKGENKIIKASFNKIYRAAIPTRAIDSAYKRNDSIPVPLRQMLYANTYSNEVYATNIANPEYWEFGTIDPNDDYNFTVEQKSCLKNGEKESYVLSSAMFWKGVLPLLMVFVMGLFIVWYITKYDQISESDNSDNTRWKTCFFILYSILFVLSIGRIFIGYNLSFTQPFSVYAFPTAVIVSPLILFSVLLFWVAFLCMEFGFDEILWGGNKAKRLLLFPIIVFILWGIFFLVKCCLGQIFTFYLLDIYNLSRANPFSDSSYVFTTTIWGLVALPLCLIVLCMLGQWKIKEYNMTKILTIVMLVGIAIAFAMQKSSVSVTLLLGCVLLFWFLGSKECLAIGLEQPLIGLKQPFKKRLTKFILLLIPLIIVGVIAWLKYDSGYIINLLLFPVIMIVVLVWQYHLHGYQYQPAIGNKERKKNITLSSLVIILVVGIVFGYAWFTAKNYNPFSSDRLTERSVAYFDFSTIQEFGYRLSEERAQFFAEQTKYAYPSRYDCYEPMHPGISSFIDPVIENDLSVPFGLIYQFGTKWWCLPIVFLIAIWAVLGFLVLRMSIKPKEETHYNVSDPQPPIYFSTYGIIRIFCMSLVLSSGLWLICSYYGIVPFTGRLIYGLGQDSIGEVFETLFLFVFMGLIGKTK